ncbi:MAG: hypothetical protein PUI85_03430 [Eubacteriales bacterium]|nr:hypothetical protein [Eubacteriales bacterium]MDY3333253.1 hypothetical protein [Gallibacter sp.]
MKNLRDLLYRKNDIFIVAVILIISAGIIFWRINALIKFPQNNEEQKDTKKTANITFNIDNTVL